MRKAAGYKGSVGTPAGHHPRTESGHTTWGDWKGMVVTGAVRWLECGKREIHIGFLMGNMRNTHWEDREKDGKIILN
jgi:hypothetical protein